MDPIVFLCILISAFIIFARINGTINEKNIPEKENAAARESGFTSYKASIDFRGYDYDRKLDRVVSIDEEHELFSYIRHNSSTVEVGKVSDILCSLHAVEVKKGCEEAIFDLESTLNHYEKNGWQINIETELWIRFHDSSGYERRCEIYFSGASSSRKALEYYRRIRSLQHLRA